MQDKQTFTINYQYYLADKAYKDSSNLVNYWNQMQDFYNGKQMPNTQNLKGLPTFIVNFCKYLVNTKASKLRGTPYTIAFQSGDSSATDKLEKFDKFVLLDLKYDVLLQQTIINMLIYGTAVEMYRFDDNEVVMPTIYQGKLVREHVDIRRFAVANNYLNDIQAQKWIMYRNLEEVGAVRERCRQFEGESSEDFLRRKERILPDDYTECKYPDPTLISHGMCTVFTRFFRKNGEVYFQSSTQNVDLYQATSLNPHSSYKEAKKMYKAYLEKLEEGRDLVNKIVDYDIDPEIPSFETVRKRMTREEYNASMSKFSRYPFVAFTSNCNFNHFYGISDIQDVISAQQVINYALTMAGKSIQDNAWSKWIAKEGALRGQKINNAGGQVLIDYSKGSSIGISRVDSSIGNTLNIVEYVSRMLDFLRTYSGATEVITGEYASQLSGYAISLLQEQGNTVFEMTQAEIWNNFAIEEAKIRLEYYLNYYDEEITFINELDESEYEANVNLVNERREFDLQKYKEGKSEVAPNYDDYPTPQRVEEMRFSSVDIAGYKYKPTPKAGRGIKYSEVVQADQINQLFKDGTISNLSYSDKMAYIDANPMIDETTRAKIKRIWETQRNSENARLVSQNKQLQQAVEQQNMSIQQLQEQITFYKNYISNLQGEYKRSLNSAKATNEYQSKAIQKMIEEQNKARARASSNTTLTEAALSEVQ